MVDVATSLDDFLATWTAGASHRGGEADELRCLPGDLVEAGKAAGLFCMALPVRLGGLGTDPMTLVETIERASYADGATGWCTLIGNSSSFCAWLEPTVAQAMLDDAPHVSTASIFAPSGRAIRDPSGDYVVDGRWAFASGCLHSEYVQLGVMVMDGDGPALRSDGQPDWRFAYVNRSEIGIVDTWDTLGLRGTGSHDVTATGIRVPPEYLASPPLDPPRVDEALYRCGFWAILPMLMSGFPLGVGRRALDEVEGLLPTRGAPRQGMPPGQDPQVHYEIGVAEAGLRAARSFLYEAIGSAWEAIQDRDELALRDRQMLHLANQQSMIAALAAVDIAYRYAGSSVVYDRSVVQRCFRDLHTGRQHIAFGIERLRGFGREALGMQ